MLTNPSSLAFLERPIKSIAIHLPQDPAVDPELKHEGCQTGLPTLVLYYFKAAVQVDIPNKHWSRVVLIKSCPSSDLVWYLVLFPQCSYHPAVPSSPWPTKSTEAALTRIWRTLGCTYFTLFCWTKLTQIASNLHFYFRRKLNMSPCFSVRNAQMQNVLSSVIFQEISFILDYQEYPRLVAMWLLMLSSDL